MVRLVSMFKTLTFKDFGWLALILALAYSDNFLPKEDAFILAIAYSVCL